MKKLDEVYGYEYLKFYREDDECIVYHAVDPLGVKVYVKVEIDDEVNTLDWIVLEQMQDDILWNEIGPLGGNAA